MVHKYKKKEKGWFGKNKAHSNAAKLAWKRHRKVIMAGMKKARAPKRKHKRK